jgi:hypothetical protein
MMKDRAKGAEPTKIDLPKLQKLRPKKDNKTKGRSKSVGF